MWKIGLSLVLVFAFAPGAYAWTQYGGDAGGTRYADLDQINRENVNDLELVWEFHTGDAVRRESILTSSAFEGTPIIAGENLVFCTPFNEIIALDPATGEERWRYDADVASNIRPANQYVCRGVTPWIDADAEQGTLCAHRLFMGTVDYRLIAVDVATGALCDGFGDGGEIQVDPGMTLLWPGEFQITSPPAVIGDVLRHRRQCAGGCAQRHGARLQRPHG